MRSTVGSLIMIIAIFCSLTVDQAFARRGHWNGIYGGVMGGGFRAGVVHRPYYRVHHVRPVYVSYPLYAPYRHRHHHRRYYW